MDRLTEHGASRGRTPVARPGVRPVDVAKVLAKALSALVVACALGGLLGHAIARGQAAGRDAPIENPWPDGLRSAR